MSRLMPASMFSDLFPDRKDPENPEKYLCRLCGKPTTNTRRMYWCSDECYNLTQRAVSWGYARYLAYQRDEGKCQICGKQLKLYTGDSRPGDEVSECHHKIPIKLLHRITVDTVIDVPFEELHWKRGSYDPKGPKELERVAMTRAFAVVYTLLFLDVNNLETLCHDHHAMKHAADNRKQTWRPPYEVASTYWANFWKRAHRDLYSRTLDDFFNLK